MTDRLDFLLGKLAAAPADRSLDQFEVEVGRGVIRHRRQASTARALSPVRYAAVGLALVMGLAGGGMTAAMGLSTGNLAAPRHAGVLSGGTELAPSSLLEGSR
ncbi:MAG TPA: hypothetical protein VF459_11290 [Caulobacteraceae bacterium]